MSNVDFLKPDLLDTTKLGGTVFVPDAVQNWAQSADQVIAGLQGSAITQTTAIASAASLTVGDYLAAIKTAIDGAAQGTATVVSGTIANTPVEISDALIQIAAKVVSLRAPYNGDRVQNALYHLQLAVNSLARLKV